MTNRCLLCLIPRPHYRARNGNETSQCRNGCRWYHVHVPVKGGYDYEFVTPPDKSLECPVCLLTLRDPHMISCCGNEFYQRCIELVQRDGKPCPFICNDPNFTTFLNSAHVCICCIMLLSLYMLQNEFK